MSTAHEELAEVITQLGSAFDDFQSAYSGRLDQLEMRLNRPGALPTTAAPAAPSESWRDTKTGASIRLLERGQALAGRDGKGDAAPSIGRVLRGLALGGKADDHRELSEERKALSIDVDPAGGYTVSGPLAQQWIDLLRARMVLAQAGVRTVPMDSATLTLAKLTADPVAAWHKENAALTDSNATFGAVTLSARTVVALVKMSVELSQDSANIESILQTSLTGALAGAIDSAGLVGASSDAGAAPGGIFNLAGRNTVTSVGAPTSWDFVIDGMYELLADNVPESAIGALIAHPALWKKMSKLKTGITSDNTPLPLPADVARLPKLWTTAAPFTGGNTCKAVIGDWRDYFFGVRQSITVRVLQETFMGSNLQLAVLAYARCDFQAVRQQSFCSMEGITV